MAQEKMANEKIAMEKMYACMCFMALITRPTLVLFATYQDLVTSVRRVHVVFSTAGFKGEESRVVRRVTTAALRRGIQKTSRT